MHGRIDDRRRLRRRGPLLLLLLLLRLLRLLVLLHASRFLLVSPSLLVGRWWQNHFLGLLVHMLYHFRCSVQTLHLAALSQDIDCALGIQRGSQLGTIG